MNERISSMRTALLDRAHHVFRRSPAQAGVGDMAEGFAAAGLSGVRRSSVALARMLEAENPVILPGERIVFTRTITSVPELFTPAEWSAIREKHYIHERGAVCNISPDYAHTLRVGLGARLMEVNQRLSDKGLDSAQREFLESTAECIIAVRSLIWRYAVLAREQGLVELAEVLESIRENGASTLWEALELLRVLHFALWESGNYHNTLGRFDQYIYPYYAADIEAGRLTPEQAFDLIEEFFLSCNKDSDLYPGMQQGDNGQSLVLGGRSADGEYLFNDVSRMCLRASYELEMIDPKINIRVDAQTPLEVFKMGSELTRIGLGFPQYSNDDIVIPGLMRKGYTADDARDYVVAACWEFIIPGVAMDIPNIGALSLIECVKDCLPCAAGAETFDRFYALVEAAMQRRLDELCSSVERLWMVPAPWMSVLMDGCVARARDISQEARYNNYGVHGTGLATAADSLAALKKFWFDERSIDMTRWLEAIDADWVGHEALQTRLRTEGPKMGQDDDEVDMIGARLLESFDRLLAGRVNERGGCWRAGTGTAMYYIWHAADLGATPDGRSAGEMIPANYSPSLFFRHRGPVSVIKSFTKPDLRKTVNGGPLTLEFDQSVFRGEESVEKLGMLVKTFISLGGHQIQLNTVNREKLIDAKKRPELYRNLIVRVWGWSGYFVELEECYQDHVINRIEFGI